MSAREIIGLMFTLIPVVVGILTVIALSKK